MAKAPRIVSFHLRSATKKHWEITLQCMVALRDALGYAPFSFRAGSRHLLTFSTHAFSADPPTCLGHCLQDLQSRWRVAIRPDLDDCTTRGIILHELAHVLGLNHTRTVDALMHIYPPKVQLSQLKRRAQEVSLALGSGSK